MQRPFYTFYFPFSTNFFFFFIIDLIKSCPGFSLSSSPLFDVHLIRPSLQRPFNCRRIRKLSAGNFHHLDADEWRAIARMPHLIIFSHSWWCWPSNNENGWQTCWFKTLFVLLFGPVKTLAPPPPLLETVNESGNQLEPTIYVPTWNMHTQSTAGSK